MNRAGRILSVFPRYAIPGGEVIIECEGLDASYERNFGCFFDGQRAKIVGASGNRVIAIAPENFDDYEVEIFLESGGERSVTASAFVAKELASDLHIVANPAIDPKDNSIITTRSGSRGQTLPVTMFRLEADGYLQEMSADVMNPTGVAFDKTGRLFVSNRANGEIYKITKEEEALSHASDLGIVTGIAFDSGGAMYAGDRRGTIFKVSEFGVPEVHAVLEPSVSAYHIAFDANDNLFVSAPALSSYDSIYKVGKDGDVSTFYHGLGRPQGIAFDRQGNLYVAACLRGAKGIVKITPSGEANIIVSGMNMIGLCFDRKGDMICATAEAVYRLPVNIYGTLA